MNTRILNMSKVIKKLPKKLGNFMYYMFFYVIKVVKWRKLKIVII